MVYLPTWQNLGKYHFLGGQLDCSFWGVKFMEINSNFFIQVMNFYGTRGYSKSTPTWMVRGILTTVFVLLLNMLLFSKSMTKLG